MAQAIGQGVTSVQLTPGLRVFLVRGWFSVTLKMVQAPTLTATRRSKWLVDGDLSGLHNDI